MKLSTAFDIDDHLRGRHPRVFLSDRSMGRRSTVVAGGGALRSNLRERIPRSTAYNEKFRERQGGIHVDVSKHIRSVRVVSEMLQVGGKENK